MKSEIEHTSTMLGSQNMKSSQRMVSVVEPYELPEGWKWVQQNEVCKLTDGEKRTGTEFPYLEVKYLRGKKEKDFVSTGKFIKAGTKVILVDGENSGEVFTVPEDGFMGSTFKALEISNVNENYLQYFIHTKKDLYRNNKKGSAIPHLDKKLFFTMPFPLPPTLAEQQRIVNRIESMFAKLDEAKEKAQNVVDGFETRKAAILHKAFTGELTAKWRKENGVEKNKELDFIYNFAQTLSKKDMTNITDFQKQAYDYVLSDGAVWKKCCIGAIGVITNGSTPSRKEASFWNGNIPWVSSGEVANNTIESTNEMISEEGFNNSSVKKLPIGTVLIAMIGEGKTRGQTSVLNIEATTNQNIAAIIINHGHVESKFLWYWLQKEYKNNRTAGNGSGPQALNCQKVRELPFILPTLPEQVEIVRILDIIIEKENKAKQAAEAVLEQIDLLKKSILARAFRGEL